MKKKINKLLFLISILAILSTVIGTTYIYYNLFQSQVKQDLAVSAKLLKDTHYFESVDINKDDIDLSTDQKELRVTWINSDGTVLYDNDVTVQALSNHLDRPEIQDAFQYGKGQTVRKSDTLKQNTFYYAILLDNGTVLRVATNARSIYSVFFSVAPIITLIILFIMSICILLSRLFTKQIIKPIEMMSEHLDHTNYSSPYPELDPFAKKLKAQHIDILSAAKARQDFTANVSHELKTPLTAILGYTELLESGMVQEDQKQHFYQEMKKNSNRLISLINDIIRLSELDRNDYTSTFEQLDLYELAKECCEELQINARQRNITLTIIGKSSMVRGNKDMLKELIENLVQNGIRYNNPNGKVEILVEPINSHSTLIVKDNGIGIPASDIDRVFERFYRVDKSRSKATDGTGLGLAIVKHIVEIHDGSIHLDSKLGNGTTITVTF